MRLTIIIVLLNALLLTASRIPNFRPPPHPEPPKLPETPNTPQNPGQPELEPGRLPEGPQDPKVPLTPVEPGRLPEQPNTPKSNTTPCSGKKRGSCDPSDAFWNQNDVTNRFQNPGRVAIERLDAIKSNPPPTYNAPGDTKFAAYTLENKLEVMDQAPWAAAVAGVKNGERWNIFTLRNRDDIIDKFLAEKKAELQKNNAWNAEEEIDFTWRKTSMQNQESILEHWTNSDGTTLVLHRFFNQRLDLYRPYTDTEFNGAYTRTGLGESESIRLTDQIMYGLGRSNGGRLTQLQNVIHQDIVTDDTRTVIKAVMEKKGQFFKDGSEIFQYSKGDDGFEALLGTVHGKRTADMLIDYHTAVGDKSIQKIMITENESDSDNYDMILVLVSV